MTGVIARKEIAQHLASLRFWVAALMVVALSALALLTSAESYESRRALRQERMEARQETRVSTYSYLQPVALRCLPPLSIIDQGVDGRLGPAQRISVFSIPESAQEEWLGNEFLPTWPAVDMTAIVGLVLAFAALLLSCDVLVKESEGGTLKALLAAGVTRRQLLAGKYLGAMGTMTGVTLAVFLIGLGFCRRYAWQDLRGGHYVLAAFLLAAYLVYLSFVVLSGLALSLHSRSSSRALVHATVGWLIAILIAPAVVSYLAIDLAGVEALRLKAQQEERALRKDWRGRMEEIYFKNLVLWQLSGDLPFSMRTDDGAQEVRMRLGSARYYDELTRFYSLFVATGQLYALQVDGAQQPGEAAWHAGQRSVRAWGMVSPRMILEEVAHSLAGTSLADHDRFVSACRDFRRRFIAYLTAKGVFRSWRWVTDDSPRDLLPWPTFLGLSPGQVSSDEAGRLYTRLGEPAIAAAVQRRLESIDDDPSKRIDLTGLPPYTESGDGAAASLRRAAGGALELLLLNVLAACLAWRAAGADG